MNPDVGIVITGAIFIAFNLFAVGGPLLAWKLYGKRSSPACLPFAGPFLLTMWALHTHKPWWVIPLVWVGDAGTVLVVVSLPKLFSSMWQTSSSTSLLDLRASDGSQTATLSIHSTGRYHLEKWGRWRPGPRGTWRGGELGNFSEANGSYLLQGDWGAKRKLEALPDGSFEIVEETLPDKMGRYSVAHWRFQRER